MPTKRQTQTRSNRKNLAKLSPALIGVIVSCKAIIRAPANAAMRIIVEQIRSEMIRRKISEAELARRMETSRSQVHRLLSTEPKSATIKTLVRVADALGKRWKVQLVPA